MNCCSIRAVVPKSRFYRPHYMTRHKYATVGCTSEGESFIVYLYRPEAIHVDRDVNLLEYRRYFE